MSYKGNWGTFLTDKCPFREGKRSGVSCRLVRGQGLSQVALGAGGVHPARVGGGPGFDFSPRTPCQPLTIETNPGKPALQGQEPLGIKSPIADSVPSLFPPGMLPPVGWTPL